ncbi:MAG: hypothetical protein WBO77_02050 [Microgenomates group bacterium]
MDSDLHKMRRYMLHHRIATYAIVLFLMLMTFILISISRQIQNEQALVLDSQAASARPNGLAQGACPANGIPFRMTYNGASSCYFGQYRSVSVRCTDGARAQIINSSTTGSFSVCADKTALEAAAKARCGCTGGGQGGPGNPAPTGGTGTTPGQPAPTFPSGGVDPLPTDVPPIATPTPNSAGWVPGGELTLCPRGVKMVLVQSECGATNPATFASASYECVHLLKGTISGKGTCRTMTYFQAQAESLCKNPPKCAYGRRPAPPSPTPTGPPTE